MQRATSFIAELSTAGAILPISQIILDFTFISSSLIFWIKLSIAIDASGKPIIPNDAEAAFLTFME